MGRRRHAGGRGGEIERRRPYDANRRGVVGHGDFSLAEPVERLGRYYEDMEHTNQTRVDALDQLKKAQPMIAEGRKELAAANKKIATAQKLIDASADALRSPQAIPDASEDRHRPR